jgi:hypothetical protein
VKEGIVYLGHSSKKNTIKEGDIVIQQGGWTIARQSFDGVPGELSIISKEQHDERNEVVRYNGEDYYKVGLVTPGFRKLFLKGKIKAGDPVYIKRIKNYRVSCIPAERRPDFTIWDGPTAPGKFREEHAELIILMRNWDREQYVKDLVGRGKQIKKTKNLLIIYGIRSEPGLQKESTQESKGSIPTSKFEESPSSSKETRRKD